MANILPLTTAQKYWQLHPERPQNLPYNWNALGPMFWAARAVCVLTYKYCLLIIYGANKVTETFLVQLKNLDPSNPSFFHGFKTLDQYDICFLSVPEINQFKEKLLSEIRNIESIAPRIALCHKMKALFHPVIALANEEYKRDAIAEMANALLIDLGVYERQHVEELAERLRQENERAAQLRRQEEEQEQAELSQQEDETVEPPQETTVEESETIFCGPPEYKPEECFVTDADDEDTIEEPEQEIDLDSLEREQLELLRQEREQKRLNRFYFRLRVLDKNHPFSAAIVERLRHKT